MAPCMDMPKQGNIDQLYHEFAFLKKKHNSEMVFDPNDSDVDDAHLSKEDLNGTVYGEFHEDLPPDAPQGRGFGFKMRALVDSDHADNSITR